MNLLGTFISETILGIIKLDGKLVDLHHSSERITRCKTLENGKPCRYAGTVTPLPLLKMDGCTVCGCPFATKPKTYSYFSMEEGKIILTTCPHPQGNMWAEIDKKWELKTLAD